MNSKSKIITQIFLISTVLWTFRLGHEPLSALPEVIDTLWLTLARPVILAVLGICVANHYLKLRDSTENKTYWTLSFISGGILCLPYFPDMYASFLKAEEAKALPLALAFFGLGILTYGGLRGVVTLLADKYALRKIQSLPLKSVILYLHFLVAEFLFFHSWHPITYFPALPLPLPASRLQTKYPATGKNNKTEIILFESYMDQKSREEISRGSSMGLMLLGERLAESALKQISDHSLASEVVVILPETFVSLADKSEIRVLADSVFRSLREKHDTERMAWIQGAFINNANVILGTEMSATKTKNESAEVFVLRTKREHMPMFEAPSKGISYSAIPETIPFEEQIPTTEQPILKKFVQESRLLICYESLFPSNWRFGKQAVVLTNHHLFTEFHLMNWVYLGFIRQISFLFGSPALLVSNYNPSGVLRPNWPWSQATASAQKAWQVISIERKQ